MKIEMHLLQNFAPSCLNRDDTNAPKECEFGGARRARISSQCLKRAVREHFRGHPELLGMPVANRTKRLKGMLLEQLADLGQPEDLLGAAVDVFLSAYYSKMDGKDAGLTAVLVFIGPREVEEAAACMRELWPELEEPARKTLAKAAKKKTDAEGGAAAAEPEKLKTRKEIQERLVRAARWPDVGLFGRMLAEQPTMNVDAACQVAHAISTHRVGHALDFYTAVDDLNPESATGAGMMGYTGYTSACFYRYALLDCVQLAQNLGDPALAERVAEAYLRASVWALPTGKQNSMAAHSQPSFGLFVVRGSGAPCSLANAFADPVRVYSGEDEDLVGRSVAALARHWQALQAAYGSDGVLAAALFHCGYEDRLGKLGEADRGSLDGAVAAVMAAVRAGR